MFLYTHVLQVYGSQSLQPDDAVEPNTVRNCVNQSYLLITYCRIWFSRFSVKICCIKYYYCEISGSHQSDDLNLLGQYVV